MSYEELNRCFTLRVRPFVREHDPRLIIIRAFDDKGWDEAGRVRLDIEVRHGGKVIFPRGQLYGAVHGCSDSKAAKEHALAMAAMKPRGASPLLRREWEREAMKAWKSQFPIVNALAESSDAVQAYLDLRGRWSGGPAWQGDRCLTRAWLALSSADRKRVAWILEAKETA